MRHFRWIAAAVAAVVTVPTVAAAVFVATLDLNAYKDEVRSVLAAATGRDVEIDGPLHLTWTPRPSLTASGVRIANMGSGSQPTMATVGDFGVDLALLPLLTGTVRVHRLRLSDVDLLLERDADGHGNWMLGGTGDAGGAGIPVVRRVELSKVVVVWKAGPTVPERRYRIDDLTLAGDGAGGPLAIALTADLDGSELRLAGTVPAVAAVLRPEATIPIALEGTLDGAAVALSADFRLERGPGDVLRAIRADGIAMSRGALAFSGGGELDLSGARPRIEATLTADGIDLDTLSGAQVGGDPLDGDPLDRPLPTDLLTTVDAAVALTVNRLVAGGLAIEGAAVTATLAGGRLILDPVAGAVAGGSVAGRVELDARVRPARAAVSGAARGLAMGTVYRALLGEALVEGRGDAALDLRATGDTPRALFGSADGNARLVVRDGMIMNRYWELIAEDVATRFLPFVADEDRGRLNCLVGRFDMRKGVAHATVLMVDSDRVTVGGAGTVDLARQTLDMRLVPRPKDPSLFSLATPILLKGPVWDPRPSPDPVAVAKGIGQLAAGAMVGPLGLLLPFLSTGSVDAPCPDAIAVAEGRRPAAGSARTREADKPGGIKGLFENLRKAIE